MINLGAAVLFTLTGRFGASLWAIASAATIAILVFSVVSWWRFTFVVVDDELVVTKGVLSVERLVIPLDRVQSVSIDQRLLHRLVGLVSASVDTAGSAGAEVEIAAIDVATAEALRRIASDARVAPSTASPLNGTDSPPVLAATRDDLLLGRSFGELAVVGATRVPWAGLAVLAPLLALGDEIGGTIGLGGRIERALERGQDVSAGSTTALFAVIASVVVGAAAFGALLQVVREVLTNWNLALHRTPTGLRRTAGLLNRTSRSSTVRRVQSITTDDTPPQRWLGMTTLTLRTFGDNHISLPGTRQAEMTRVRDIVFGESAPPLDRRISRWFVFLAVRNAAAAALVGTAVLWFRVGWWAAVVLVVVPIRWTVARRQWRLRRWGLSDTGIAESYELVTRHTTETQLFKAQIVSVTQTFFERRRGLATLRVQMADGFLSVPLIGHADAMAVRDRVLGSVATDRRPTL